MPNSALNRLYPFTFCLDPGYMHTLPEYSALLQSRQAGNVYSIRRKRTGSKLYRKAKAGSPRNQPVTGKIQHSWECGVATYAEFGIFGMRCSI